MSLETHWHWYKPYIHSLEWQLQRKDDIANNIGSEALLFCEHLPCITLGKRGGVVHMEKLHPNTSIHHINRGGLATWHGPGQLVLYPIIHLHQRSLGVRQFVCVLQRSVLKLVSLYGISAHADTQTAGIWVKEHKIASIGVEIKNGISIHGCAVNVCTDLSVFTQLDPCGETHPRFTTVQQESPIAAFSMHDIGLQWRNIFLQELLQESGGLSYFCRKIVST